MCRAYAQAPRAGPHKVYAQTRALSSRTGAFCAQNGGLRGAAGRHSPHAGERPRFTLRQRLALRRGRWAYPWICSGSAPFAARVRASRFTLRQRLALRRGRWQDMRLGAMGSHRLILRAQLSACHLALWQHYRRRGRWQDMRLGTMGSHRLILRAQLSACHLALWQHYRRRRRWQASALR